MDNSEMMWLVIKAVNAYRDGIRSSTTDEYIDVWVLSHPGLSAATVRQARDYLGEAAGVAARGLGPGDAQALKQWLTANNVPATQHRRYRFLHSLVNRLAQNGFWPLEN